MAHVIEDKAVRNEIQKTVDLMKTTTPQPAALDPEFKKTFNTSSGLQPYNLEPFVGTLVPLLTPIRNSLPRLSGRGKQVEFKTITGINTAKLNGFVAEGSAGSLVTTSFNDVTAKYASMALADQVTYEQEWEGKPYVESRALAVANLLRATMIAEENNILWGQNSTGSASQQAPGAVGATSTPTLAVGGTGGTIPTGNAYVKAVGFTGFGAAQVSAEATVAITSGELLTITPTFNAGQPIVGFKLYAGTATGVEYLVTAANVVGGALYSDNFTTNGQPIVLSSVPTSGETPAAYAADASSSTLSWNGIIPQIFAGGGYTKAVNGALGMTDIKMLFKKLYDNAKGDPNVLYVGSTESQTITDLVLGSSNTPYSVLIEEQNGAAGGVKVNRLVNPQTGSIVKVYTHPNMYQGMMVALQTELPGWYPGAEVPSPIAMDLVQDYTEINYAPTYSSPNWTTEVRMLGTLKLYIPMLQGVLYGITPPAGF